MPRFVLLRHECPAGFEKPSHWDLMLEQAGVLLTWELRTLPASWEAALGLTGERATGSVPAYRLPEHRLAYLDYEGPISQNRGTVTRVAAGVFDIMQLEPTVVVAILSPDSLRGTIRLRATGTSDQWELEVEEV